MTTPRLPLAYRLFGAISLTALGVVVIMALLVGLSMRDGFSKYLLREELTLHANLAKALAEFHESTGSGWSQFRNDPAAWPRFIREHETTPPRPTPPAPPEHPERPAPPAPLGQRLILLDAEGNIVAGGNGSGAALETLPIRAEGADEASPPLGWLGIIAPSGIQNETDLFFMRSQLRALLLSAAIALVLSGIGAALLARQFLVPIHALERGAKRLAGGEYSARIPRERNDELGRLIDHYNALAESLEAAEKAQQQWVSDTSHELQTPLAVLRAHVEAIQDGIRPADARTLNAMSDAVARLTRLVADLRILSAWREDGPLTDRRPADFAQIAREATDAVYEAFSAAGLELIVKIAGPIPMTCDAGRIRQVIDNLLENALRYTDAPGTVQLRAWASDETAYLMIDDTPPAPPEASMPYLFDRFHRGEASRSRDHGGSGLGLAICKALVEAHGGTIAAARSRMGGLSVHLTLPLGETTT